MPDGFKTDAVLEKQGNKNGAVRGVSLDGRIRLPSIKENLCHATVGETPEAGGVTVSGHVEREKLARAPIRQPLAGPHSAPPTARA